MLRTIGHPLQSPANLDRNHCDKEIWRTRYSVAVSPHVELDFRKPSVFSQCWARPNAPEPRVECVSQANDLVSLCIGFLWSSVKPAASRDKALWLERYPEFDDSKNETASKLMFMEKGLADYLLLSEITARLTKPGAFSTRGFIMCRRAALTWLELVNLFAVWHVCECDTSSNLVFIIPTDSQKTRSQNTPLTG